MNRFVFSLLLCVAGIVHADEFAGNRAEVLALGRLTIAPAMMDAEGFRKDDSVRAIFFDALDYEGKPTKVFAWLGIPKKRIGKVAGIVLVHGGGGSAFRQWVENTFYREVWDLVHYLPRAEMPALWFSWPEDQLPMNFWKNGKSRIPIKRISCKKDVSFTLFSSHVFSQQQLVRRKQINPMW